MALTGNEIDEFITLFERAHGERLEREDARIMVTRLLQLYRVLLRPLPGEKADSALDSSPTAFEEIR